MTSWTDYTVLSAGHPSAQQVLACVVPSLTQTQRDHLTSRVPNWRLLSAVDAHLLSELNIPTEHAETLADPFRKEGSASSLMQFAGFPEQEHKKLHDQATIESLFDSSNPTVVDFMSHGACLETSTTLSS